MPIDEPDPTEVDFKPSSKTDDLDAEVGYRRPPKQHEIKPGETRNPWGRRGKPRPPTEFLEEMVWVTVKGRKQKITRDQAINVALFGKAMNGSVAAAKFLDQREAKRHAAAGQSTEDSELSAENTATFDRFMDREIERRRSEREPQR